MTKHLKKAVHDLEASLSSKHGKVDQKALKALQDWWVEGSYEDGTLPVGLGKALVSTTQAVDIINGGLKVNALVCVSIGLKEMFTLISHPARRRVCCDQPPDQYRLVRLGTTGPSHQRPSSGR